MSSIKNRSGKPMSFKEKILVYLLRITGNVMAIALVFVFCPLDWMDSIHRMLGLGPLPSGAIVEYLARTESALYAYLGFMLCFISLDVPRYQSLIRFLAWTTIPFSIGVTLLDMKLGLPLFWTASEGPFTLLLGVILLFLTKPYPWDKKSE
jgi:hypothetical protein